ncbi:hypothetical protein [Dictyobacter formicarum]|uniref:Sialidase domain-containing protein n=1 Tax=Dictyobacter formicarum TaxID=2778368 RepID=A0ABQ3VRV2_9CHLR|nr:hypothetical protein [Dictyobacter formicarum]GHO88446.1 hypothetical protein KSZ_64520 [Dictyobacter formicarum]
MPATLPLLWKTRERRVACVLVVLIFIVSLVSVFGEFSPAKASAPLWRSLQASTIHSNDGLTSIVPGFASTQTNADVPSITPTYPSTNQPSADTSTPTNNFPPSTSYPPANSTGPVADQPSYPVTTQPTSAPTTGSTNRTTQPTNPPSSTEVPNPTSTQPANPTSTPTPDSAQTCATSTASATPTPTATSTSTASATPTPTVTPTSTPSVTPTATATPEPNPALTSLEQVTDGAFGQNGVYVPNSWGVQKSRIVRTSTGDIFTIYIDAGTGQHDRTWHLMHRSTDRNWEEVKITNINISHDAGTEPVNLLVGPNDELHLFAWPGTKGKLVHLFSKDLGKTFDSEDISGGWSTDQGYSGATINTNGDMVVYQTAEDVPGHFLWSYYSSTTQKWTFHTNTLDCRYTYAFFFLGDKGDLTITAMRDVKRPELGLPSSSGFNYIFNAIGYFYTKDVTATDPQLTPVKVTEIQPKNNTDYDITYLTDSYIDSSNRVHILYNNLYDGLHHVIIENGKIVKDEKQDISLGTKARITQDSEGRFYLITMNKDGKTLNIYPGSDSDTDGTQLLPAVQLDISKYPGCSDDDFCHSPTFTVSRSGNARSDVIDGVYGNFTKEIYFQIDLHGKS